jgi:hypothetical protein
VAKTIFFGENNSKIYPRRRKFGEFLAKIIFGENNSKIYPRRRRRPSALRGRRRGVPGDHGLGRHGLKASACPQATEVAPGMGPESG